MLFELGVASVLLYFGATGSSVRRAAREAGRVLGRASGSLRRVRAEVDRVQARAEALGGQGLRDSRADIASRLSRLRAIQAEAAALTSVYGAGSFSAGGSGGASGAAFTDEEIAAATRGLPLGHTPHVAAPMAPVAVAAAPSGPRSAAPPEVAYHTPDGRPVIIGRIEHVTPAPEGVGRHPEWGFGSSEEGSYVGGASAPAVSGGAPAPISGGAWGLQAVAAKDRRSNLSTRGAHANTIGSLLELWDLQPTAALSPSPSGRRSQT